MRYLVIICLLAITALLSGADPVLATINYASGANLNMPVTVTTNATESAIVFTTSSGDNPRVQYVNTVAWTWLAVAGGGSATASLPVAANQTLTLRLDGGALSTTHYCTSTTTGTLKITRVGP